MLTSLIEISGWIYVLAWSFSFYAQVYLNYKLKNVQGLNLDFLALNLSGYIFYAVYCIYGYFWKGAQAETGQVDLHDLLFVLHANFITIVAIIQACIYPKGKNKISFISIGYIVSICSFLVCYALLTYVLRLIQPRSQLSPICFMGYYKLSISFLKCWPQMIWNFKRKSTKGWSTSANILDLIGGIFAFIQICLQKQQHPNIQVNLIKLILAVMSIFYHSVFLVQALCLYPSSSQQNRQMLNDIQYAKSQYIRQTEKVLQDNIKQVIHFDQFVIQPIR